MTFSIKFCFSRFMAGN
ncbi:MULTISPECIES: peptide IlvX [Klebsiella]|nr:peptide IlvX [Klebsiella sp.]MCA4031155.1 peptide IlvX [Klebsiella quasipneumoniae]MCY0046035.1 peptide IlvX [Klebsiella quasipneumoniae]UZF53141.1 peptide IlvX [Klebsiella quasipneumoniae]